MSVVQRIHERRVATRVDSESRVILTEPGEPGAIPGDEEFLAPLFGTALNLSETGVLVELDEPILTGRPVSISLELDGRVLDLRGRVARSTRVRGSSKVRLGIEFEGLSEAERDAIRERTRRAAVCAYLN